MPPLLPPLVPPLFTPTPGVDLLCYSRVNPIEQIPLQQKLPELELIGAICKCLRVQGLQSHWAAHKGPQEALQRLRFPLSMLTFLLFLKPAGYGPTPGPLHLLISLPGKHSPMFSHGWFLLVLLHITSLGTS